GEHIAGAEGHIDLGDPRRGEIEVGEVTGVPLTCREVLLGDGDEEFVEVDAEDGVSFAQEQPPGSAGPAAGIADAGLARRHGLAPAVAGRGAAVAPQLRGVGPLRGIGPAYLLPRLPDAPSARPRTGASGAVPGRRPAGSRSAGPGRLPPLPKTAGCSATALLD